MFDLFVDNLSPEVEHAKQDFLKGIDRGDVVSAISYHNPSDAMEYLADALRGGNLDIALNKMLRIGTDTRTDALIKAEYIGEDSVERSDVLDAIGNLQAAYWGLHQNIQFGLENGDGDESFLDVLTRTDLYGSGCVAGECEYCHVRLQIITVCTPAKLFLLR